ncbi:MAG: zinc-dependent alcohol dehydrogenase family protein [Gaiellaceae bacterium]|jgi:2-desacetyl-2-hydroxyethyl bacteriochlorophyllide A dehydrogenase
MQAVVFPKPHTINIENVADPACGLDEVVVRVSQVGICGTDLHIYRGEYHSDFPLIAGHEFVGEIVEVGKSVDGLQRGERVAVDPNLNCGECYFCRQEQANHCLHWQAVGVTRPGAFSEYVAVPARACYAVPDDLTDAQAAFVEPLSCVVYALKRLRVSPADEVLIFGAGPMGLLLVQALRHSGASQVVVVEKEPGRRDLAEQMGASVALAAGLDAEEGLRGLAPYGYAVVVDATGEPAVIEPALRFLKPRGQYLQFGVAPEGVTVQWSPYEIYRKDLTIIGSFALCYTFQPAIAWMASGIVDVAPLISHTLPLAEFPRAFQDFAAGKTLKVHFRPGA